MCFDSQDPQENTKIRGGKGPKEFTLGNRSRQASIPTISSDHFLRTPFSSVPCVSEDHALPQFGPSEHVTCTCCPSQDSGNSTGGRSHWTLRPDPKPSRFGTRSRRRTFGRLPGGDAKKRSPNWCPTSDRFLFLGRAP